MRLQDGLASDGDKRGQVISPLYNALVDHVSAAKQIYSYIPDTEWSGEILLLVDSAVPYSTLAEVLYTAGQGQLSSFFFVVSDADSAPLVPFTRAASDRRVTVLENSDGLTVQVSSREAPYQDTDLPQLLQEVFPEDGPDCALYTPRSTDHWAHVAARVDQLRERGVRLMILTSPAEDTDTHAAAEASGSAEPLSLQLTGTASVLVVYLPAVNVNVPGQPPVVGECHNRVDLVGTRPESPSITSPVGSVRAGVTLIGSDELGSRGEGLGGGGSASGLSGMGTRPRSSVNTGDMGSTLGVSTLGPLLVEGALDTVAAEAVVKRHMNQLRYCYQRELNRSPGLHGSVTLRVHVLADGSVSSVEVSPSPSFNAAVEGCLTDRFRRFQFPTSSDGNPFTIELSLTFSDE